MEEKVSNFVEKCIAKNAFHKKEKPKPIKVDKVEIKRIVLSKKKNTYGKKGSFKYFI